MTCTIFLVISILFTITRAQDRAPHGVAYQNPMAITPETYNFFHPADAQTQGGIAGAPCASSENCSTPLPVAAASVESTSTPANEAASSTTTGGKKLGGSGIATITIGVLSALLVVIGVYHLLIIRGRNNAFRAQSANQLKPDV